MKIAKIDSLPELTEVERFPDFETIKHGELYGLPLSLDTRCWTHGLHRFPAKYIPQVPRWALAQFTTKDSVVLDPFMGSGTTLVEGGVTVKKTIGIDIDPLARLISEAKVAVYNISNLNKIAQKIFAAKNKKTIYTSVPMEGVENINHWFSSQAMNELGRIYSAIHEEKCTETERKFFLCVFSSIIRWVSNADDQTQKTYVSGTLIKNPPAVWPTFEKALLKAIAGVESLEKIRGKSEAVILNASALDIPLGEESIDLVVTSPPYLDSVDYMYNFMLEYFWLGPYLGIDTRANFNKHRRESVGSKHPSKSELKLPHALKGLVQLEQVPVYRMDSVIRYFQSMDEHFSQAAKILKNKGRYVLVIGNSQTEGSGALPVHDCLVQLAYEHGLMLEKAFAYRIRRHYMKFPRKGRGGIILMDWVIVLRKEKTKSRPKRLPMPKVIIGINEVAH